MSLASVAAQQNTANAAANLSAAGLQGASTTAATAATAAASNTALTSLSANFGDFLNLLMTQLQNQDPTSPLDTNQFTSELVQFSSVEQQINTNTSLTQLIQLTQAGEVMQASAMTGKHVTVTSDHVPLQNGRARSSSPRRRRTGGYRDLQQHRRQAVRCDHDVGEGHRTPGPGTARTVPATHCRTAATRSRWSAPTPTAPRRR